MMNLLERGKKRLRDVLYSTRRVFKKKGIKCVWMSSDHWDALMQKWATRTALMKGISYFVLHLIMHGVLLSLFFFFSCIMTPLFVATQTLCYTYILLLQ